VGAAYVCGKYRCVIKMSYRVVCLFLYLVFESVVISIVFLY
jgi:hypothetical protein